MDIAQSQLLRLLEKANLAQAVFDSQQPDRGLADIVRFPFLGIVGQVEMKSALILTLINPAIGGVLLIGPRGTGKTTAVRGLVDLMPILLRSTCAHGCTVRISKPRIPPTSISRSCTTGGEPCSTYSLPVPIDPIDIYEFRAVWTSTPSGRRTS